MKILRDFSCWHKFVTLAADVMFFNSIPFLVTFSRKIRYITVENLSTSTAGQFAKPLINVVKLYNISGFVICLVLMDMEFENIKDKVGLVEVNTTVAREHVR